MRNKRHSLKTILTKKFLTKEYICHKKSTHKIAAEINCDHTSVWHYLKKYKIPTRTLSNCQTSLFGPESRRWKGGQFMRGGYVLVYTFNKKSKQKKYIKRARLVMEQYLGRKIKPQEIVHHINGNKMDDNLKNLYLFKNKQEHNRFHLLFLYWILNKYNKNQLLLTFFKKYKREINN